MSVFQTRRPVKRWAKQRVEVDNTTHFHPQHNTMMRYWWLCVVLCLAVHAQNPPDNATSTSSNAVTKTASNAKQGALAGTAIAPGPNQHGKTGPDDKHFVNGAAALPLALGIMWVTVSASYMMVCAW